MRTIIIILLLIYIAYHEFYDNKTVQSVDSQIHTTQEELKRLSKEAIKSLCDK